MFERGDFLFAEGGAGRHRAVAEVLQLRSILPHLAMCLRTGDPADFQTVLRVADCPDEHADSLVERPQF